MVLRSSSRGVDEDLLGYSHASVTSEDGCTGGGASAATVAHDGNAAWVLEVGGMTYQPAKPQSTPSATVVLVVASGAKRRPTERNGTPVSEAWKA
jgi:hypothetical protein